MMFTTATNANKETSQALKHWDTYSTRFVYGRDATTYKYKWVSIRYYIRHITKDYKYVGLTEAAAKDIVASKIAQYTVTTKGVIYNPDDTSAGPLIPTDETKLVAEIAAVHVAGHMWEVVIKVNRIDECWVKDSQTPTWPDIVPSDYDE